MLPKQTFRLLAGRDIEAHQSVVIDEATRLIVPANDNSQAIGGAVHAAKAGEYVEVSPYVGTAVSDSRTDEDGTILVDVEFNYGLYAIAVYRLTELEAEHRGRHN